MEFDDQSKQCILSEEDSISQKDDISISSSPTHHFYDLVCLDNRKWLPQVSASISIAACTVRSNDQTRPKQSKKTRLDQGCTGADRALSAPLNPDHSQTLSRRRLQTEADFGLWTVDWGELTTT